MLRWCAQLVAITACHAAPPAQDGSTPRVVVAAPPSPAATQPDDPPPSTLREQSLRFEWSESWNRHWGGAGGADHANHSGSVSLSISSEGRCTVTDSGEKIDSVLDGGRHEKTTTRWTARWQGACRLEDGKLRLELTPEAAGTCEKIFVARRRGAQQFAPISETCKLADRLRLECERDSVESAASKDDPSGELERLEVWNCLPGEPAGEGVASPFAWVFGMDRCIERLGGGRPAAGPLRYARCGK